MTICGACGQENPDGFRFCGSCGASLDVEQPAEREERKVVSVLFADLVGFTSRSEQLDPEDVRAILAGYHARLRSELERHGGTVEKFIGDAVMAVFGAPASHEDDPERAVRAALAIRDAIAEERAGGGELHVRIGVTTGVALIRLGVRPETGEGLAAGDVVNTAARLQSAAPVDGILVDEATFRATERVIDHRPAEPVQAKGKSDPIVVWEAIEARSRLGADVARTARAPLAGRLHEKSSLIEALARVRRDREPQLVTLIGVPGIGKSRLVYELLQAVEDDPELIVWRQGRCLPYGEGAGYRALADVVKAQAGILETDDGEAALVKLRRAVASLLPDPEDAARVERQLLPLAGLADGSHAPSREEAFTAWRRFVESLAEDGPAVVVLEDVHWADDMLLDFVEHLTEWAAGVPLLVLCVARPELLSRRPGWGGGQANATTLSLAPLADEEMAKLVAALLERAVMPADVQAALLRRAGGNPLYAEELVRLADESGFSLDDASSLPPSIEGIIAARLDVLDPPDKALLQDAAVIGKVFWLGSVAALAELESSEAERRLHELVRRQIVRPERRSAVAGEGEYSFWHVLVREVAYRQIPRAERAHKHRLAAEWIASLSSDRLADRADLLAHHYLTAVDFARASGQDATGLAESARQAARTAGERALSMHAYPAAERSFRRALELSPPEDAERPRLLLSLAQAIFRGQDAGEGELVEARDSLLAVGDLEGAAEAEAMLGDHAWIRGRTSETVARLERAAELVAELPASPAKAYVVASASRFLMLAGRNVEAIATGRQALELAQQLGLEEVRAHALNNVGSARASLGDQGGLQELEESIAIGERLGSPVVIRGYINLASNAALQGDMRRGRELHFRGHEAAERFGQRRGLGFLAAELAVDAYVLGEWSEARERAAAFLRSVAHDEPHYMEAPVRLILALLAAALGDVTEAQAASERGLELARAAADPQVLLPALASAAAVDADLGDHDRAGALLDELLGSLATLETSGVALWIYPAVHPFAELDRLDELTELLGSGAHTRWGEAARLHHSGDAPAAADVLYAIGSLSDEARTRLHAAEALTVAGRRAEAVEQLERALAFYRSVGATLYLRRGERLLRASA